MDMVSTFRKRAALVALALAFSLVLTTTASAQKAQKDNGQETAEDAAAFVEAVKKLVNRSDEGLTTYVLDDGTKVVDLQGRFHSVAVAQAQPDGTVSTQCVSTEQEARELLSRADSKTVKPAGKKITQPDPAALEVK